MKNLQDDQEVIWEISGNWQFKAMERRPLGATSVTLLLHGLDERGLRIYRKLIKHLPSDTYVIAPNGPFPLPRVKADRLDFGFAWYFYNRFTQKYDVDQTLALSLLKGLLMKANPLNLPVNIIGFSQGGYLAPLLAYEVEQTKMVIGIGCEFKTRFFTSPPKFSLMAIHGEKDPVIDFEHAEKEVKKLKEKGIEVDWRLIPELKHEINQDVGEMVKTIMEQYGK